MTAVTGPPTAAQIGWGPSQGVRHVAQDGPLKGRSATAARPVPPGGGFRDSRVTTPGRLSPQAAAAKCGTGGPLRDSPQPNSARLAEGGPELSAETLVEGLDGSERKLLLDHLARAHPELVEAGVAWLAEYHAANAERRRADRKRKEKDRRRRRRAEERDGG